MRSKRFCAEDRGFLSEAEHFRVDTRFACRCPWYLHLSPWLLALCVPPGLQVSWHVFVCMARSVLVSTVRRLGQRYVGGSVARGFIFLSVFRVCPSFAVMLSLFGAVCSISLVLVQFGKTHVWTGQGHIFATLQYMRWAPSWIELKPEDLQKQVGKLAEKYDALVVDVTLRDGFSVPQVELGSGIKFLRILKKEGFAPSIPEVLYFFVKKAKSIQKHLDKKPQRQRFEVPSHPR